MYISEPFSAKQQRKITKICVVWERKSRQQIILVSLWNLKLLMHVMLKLRFASRRGTIREVLTKNMNSLLNGILVGVASPAAQGPLWIDFFS